MSKKYKKTKAVRRKVKEPPATYGEPELRVFHSFEEAELDNYKWLATLTPIQHLQHTTALIKRIFSEELKKHPRIGNKLYFD